MTEATTAPPAPITDVPGLPGRVYVIAAGLGLTAVLALSLAGEWAVGLLICTGLALGAVNSRLTRASIARFTATGQADKRKFAVASLVRLGYVTGVAAVFVFAFPPNGWTILVGIATFQVVVMCVTSLPLLKEIRRA